MSAINQSLCRDGNDRTDQVPWRDREILQTLYVDQGLTQAEVADSLGCSRSTISLWMKLLGVDVRPPHSELRFHIEYGRNAYPTIRENSQGEQHTVRVHQILALCSVDPETYFGNPGLVVHHRTGCKLDNRPEAIAVIDQVKHGRLHGTGEAVVDEEGYCEFKRPEEIDGDQLARDWWCPVEARQVLHRAGIDTDPLDVECSCHGGE